MELNDLFLKHEVDLTKMIVMRHRPDEPGLRKVLPWMVHERPGVFNAYQQSARDEGSGRSQCQLMEVCGRWPLVIVFSRNRRLVTVLGDS